MSRWTVRSVSVVLALLVVPSLANAQSPHRRRRHRTQTPPAATAPATTPPPPAAETPPPPPPAQPAATTPPPPPAAPTQDARSERRQHLLQMGTRPFFVAGSIGAAIGAVNVWSQFALNLSFGYHFQRNSAGPVLSLELQQSFGPGYTFEPGVRFAWDIPLTNRLPLYLSPGGQLGMAVAAGWGWGLWNAPAVAAFFDVQTGVDVKFILADRGLLFVRPVNFDLGIGSVVFFRYDFMLGGGVTF